MENVDEIIESPDDITTENVIEIGDTFHGDIDVLGDEDWIAIGWIAGVTYEFSQTGNTLFDPYLYLHDSTGALLIQNDDAANEFRRHPCRDEWDRHYQPAGRA